MAPTWKAGHSDRAQWAAGRSLFLRDSSRWSTSSIWDGDLTVKESCEHYIVYLSQHVGQGHRDISELLSIPSDPMRKAVSSFVATVRGFWPLRRTLTMGCPEHTNRSGCSPQERRAATWDLVLHQGGVDGTVLAGLSLVPEECGCELSSWWVAGRDP